MVIGGHPGVLCFVQHLAPPGATYARSTFLAEWRMYCLYRFGYTVFPGPPAVDPAVSAQWFVTGDAAVAGGPGRFSHAPRGREVSEWLAHVMWGSVRESGLLQMALGEEMALLPRNIYALRDTPEAGAQKPHVDWPTHKVEKYRNNVTHTPLSSMWACSAPFRFQVGEHGDQPQHMITIRTGEMLVFRGDLWHGGGGHLTTAFRVHGYLARPCDRRPGYIYTRRE